MSVDLQVRPLRFKQFAENQRTVVDADGYIYEHPRTWYGIRWYETNDRKVSVYRSASGWQITPLGQDEDVDSLILNAMLDQASFLTRRAAVQALEQLVAA